MALYSRPRNTRFLVISLVLVSLLTITVDYRSGDSGPFGAAGRGALAVVGALQGAADHVLHPIGAFFTGLAHVGSLQAQNRALEEENRKLRAENSEIVSLQRDNQVLKKLVDVQRELLLNGVGANVIGQTVGNFEWAVTIDRGSADGVRLDMPVITGDGLVGHVMTVSPHASKVQLIIDPNSSVAARLTSSGETGLVLGQRDRDLRMDLVNPQTKVLPSELVVTSGYQGGLYPPEIPIGTVSHVYREPGGLTKVIAVRPAVDFSALEVVLVVTGP